jgi:hypothetical protein
MIHAADAIQAHLTRALQEFCSANGLPQLSADELLMGESGATHEQRMWLSAFVALWDATQ